jgi:hypothetical protein
MKINKHMIRGPASEAWAEHNVVLIGENTGSGLDVVLNNEKSHMN